MSYTQDNRLISISTPLGKDVLLLQEFTGFEGISRLFQFKLNLLSAVNKSISFESILGQKVTISIVMPDNSMRHINGRVSKFVQTAQDPRFTAYQMEVVPWLWYLTRTADCRIFQKKTIPDIIKQVFNDFGFSDFSDKTQGITKVHEYCVQYRETAFNFVTRLMEEEGIFYFFKHEEDKHTLVMANTPDPIMPCPGQSSARYVYHSDYHYQEDVITAWTHQQEIRPGRYALGDFNFETPLLDLTVNAPSITKVGGNDNFEIYDYPGEYLKKGEGDSLAKLRIQEEETPYKVAHGSGFCRSFVSGHKFDLQEHYRSDLNGSYVLTEVQHAATVGDNYQTSGAYGAEVYSNRFTCIPASVPFRPPRTTPRPLVQGTQTAIVVGPPGEEIYTDKYGRIKVQFHWDREGKYNEKSSCWIRVSQAWAGKGWGAMAIPRIGQEVIVDFLEGDPDQPIVIGCVYNASQVVPYTLPDHQTKTTIKSYSSKGGGGFNELRIEDKKGSEQLFFHAEKNHDIRVKNDTFETIGNERHLIVGKDQFELVKGDYHGEIKGDQNEKIGATSSLTIGQDWHAKVGMNHAVEAGMAMHLKAGMNVVIEAGVQLTIKAGASFINLSPAGIAISGTPMVLINSGGAAGTGAGAKPEAPKPAKEADKAQPGSAKEMPPPKTPPVRANTFSPGAVAMREAFQSAAPFCDI